MDRWMKPKIEMSQRFSFLSLTLKSRRFSFLPLSRSEPGILFLNDLRDSSSSSLNRSETGLPPSLQRVSFLSFSPHSIDNLWILSRIRNPHFVNLLGFSLDKKRLIVVEYMPNGTLYDQLHSRPRPPGWARRVQFAMQIAKAIEILHALDPPVIHRDIKSSNVLIDENWNARLGDFGLAVSGHVKDLRLRSTPPPAGTLGYIDPGYVLPENLSTKSDVFSFGILLLEIISERNAIDVNYSPPSVVDWAVPLIKRAAFDPLLDACLGPPKDPLVGHQLGVLATRCVRLNVDERPSMLEVVNCLKGVRKRVPLPIWDDLTIRLRNKRVSNVQGGVVDSN